MTQPESRSPRREASSSETSAATSSHSVLVRAEEPAVVNNKAQAASNGQDLNGHSSGDGAINVDDPRTRVLLEQLLTTLSQDNTPTIEKPQRGPSLNSVLGALRRRWLPMALLFVVALVGVTWKLRPGKSHFIASSTMLLPTSGGAGSAADAALAVLGGRKDTPGGSIDTQIAILQSPLFQKQARDIAKRKMLKDKKDPTYVDSTSVSAAAPVSPELITITVTSPEAEAATYVANANVDAFAQRMRSEGDKIHDANIATVQQQVNQVNSQLQKAKIDLQRYKDATGVFSIETALQRSSQQITELEAKARAARIDAEAGATGPSISGDGITNNLQQKAADARAEYQSVLRDFYPTSPEAKAAESEWRAAQALVDQRVNMLTRQQRQQAVDAERELAEARRSASVLPAVEFRLSQLTQKVAQLEVLYKTLSDRYNALLLTRNSKSPAASNLTPAVSAAEVNRTWSRAVMMGLLVAVVLAFACGVLLEQLDSSLHSTEDLEPLLPAAVLGTMPLLRGRAERRLAHITGAQPMAPLILESCRIIRSNLAFATMDAPVRSVLVTSADPGEGKSLSALNLATVMAFDGRSVALVDCDLRRPSQHTLNGLGLEPGFTNILSGETTLEEALQSTSVANLKVLTAGTLPLNPPELLGSRAARELVSQLKESFDVIIIDSPPVLALTDAQVLCSVADGVVMVVAADSTPKAHVQRAQAMLRHAGGRLLGAVFNKAKSYNSPDTYGGYYSYGNNIVGHEKRLSESMGGLSKRA
jgi:succinoglycan biosynthesis transport protein ExoP